MTVRTLKFLGLIFVQVLKGLYFLATGISVLVAYYKYYMNDNNSFFPYSIGMVFGCGGIVLLENFFKAHSVPRTASLVLENSAVRLPGLVRVPQTKVEPRLGFIEFDKAAIVTMAQPTGAYLIYITVSGHVAQEQVLCVLNIAITPPNGDSLWTRYELRAPADRTVALHEGLAETRKNVLKQLRDSASELDLESIGKKLFEHVNRRVKEILNPA